MGNKNNNLDDQSKKVITGSGNSAFMDSLMAKINNPKFAVMFMAAFAVVGIGFGALAFAGRPAVEISRVPYLELPENFSIHESAPTLQWDRFSWSGGYDVEYTQAKDASFDNGIIASLNRKAKTHVPDITADGDYIWRVRGVGRYGSPGPWSEVWGFTIQKPETDPNPLPPTTQGEPTPPTTQPEAFYVQAEDYNKGGQNVGYYDTTSGNTGNSYRTDDVDIGGTTDEGGGFRVGWVADGEWTKYNFNVNSTSAYSLSMRVARLKYNDRADTYFRLYVDGQAVGNRVTVSDTGAWENWKTLSVGDVQLTEGAHVLEFRAVDNKGMQHLLNLNWFGFTPTGSVSEPPAENQPPVEPEVPPPSSEPESFFIQAEDYNTGGKNVGYNDTTAGNTGGKYRNDDVDIGTASDEGGGYVVGWVVDGEWLKYDFTVEASSDYKLSMRLARYKYNSRANTYFKAYVDGKQVGSRVTVTSTGGWQNWITVEIGDVNLNAGNHKLEFKAVDNQGMQHLLNLNWFSFVPTEFVEEPAPAPAPTPEPTPTPTPPPPEPEPTPTPTPPPTDTGGSSSDCKPGPFVGSCAYSHNTGFRVPASSLTKAGGMSIRQDNTVIDRMEIYGTINVYAKNVVIRDSWIYNNSFWTIYVRPGGSLTIEHTTIGKKGYAGERGLGGSNVTGRYLDISRHEDGIKFHSNANYDHVWVHDLDSSGTGPHADAVQAESTLDNSSFTNSTLEGLWASDSRYAGSNATGGGNAAVILKTDFGDQKNAWFENTYFNGGNYIIFVKNGKNFGPPTNTTFKDCLFGPDMRYGLIAKTGQVNSINNRWYESNQPLSL